MRLACDIAKGLSPMLEQNGARLPTLSERAHLIRVECLREVKPVGIAELFEAG